MTAQQAVLLFGTMMLIGCGSCFLVICHSNPLFKGLNWMGMALMAGGLGAGCALGAQWWPSFGPLADTSVLLALVCCYRADRHLLGLEQNQGKLTSTLLGCQAVNVVLEWSGLLHAEEGMALAGVLCAVQLSRTVQLIRGYASGKSRPSARFTVILMITLAGASLLRGGLALSGVLFHSPWSGIANLLICCLFTAMAVALGFAFFWRMTTKLSAELEHAASTDPLTRVFNRRVFLQWCESEQGRSQRNHALFSVLMLDFDHFKDINDNYGHHVGDQVLCAAVERIQDSIRGIDVLCRWGGEEFAVLLPNASEEATLIVAERVRRNVRLVSSTDPQFTAPMYAGLQLSVSIGTATLESDKDSFTLMLQRADSALYEAKRTGRNRVVRSMRAREIGAFAHAELVKAH